MGAGLGALGDSSMGHGGADPRSCIPREKGGGTGDWEPFALGWEFRTGPEFWKGTAGALGDDGGERKKRFPHSFIINLLGKCRPSAQ